MTLIIGAPHGVPLSSVDPGVGSIQLIGRVTDGEALVERVLNDLPDVAIVDTRIAGHDVRAVCRRISEWAPATAVVVVTPDDDEAAYTALVSGAAAVVCEPFTTEGLLAVAAGAARGESSITPRCATRMLNDLDAWAERAADPLQPPPTFTRTERQVIVGVAQGADPWVIAEYFDVTAPLILRQVAFAVAKLQRYARGVERSQMVGELAA